MFEETGEKESQKFNTGFYAYIRDRQAASRFLYVGLDVSLQTLPRAACESVFSRGTAREDEGLH